MLDRNSFMETLRSVAEIRRTSTEPLSKEEVLKYFEGMELTEEQTEMVYQYLLLPPEVQTAEPEPEEEEEPAQIVEEPEEENIYFKMYLEELEQIEEMSEEEMQAAYKKLLAGDTSVIAPISESWLRSIAELAIPYAAQGANLQDVIQEGNMGLLLKLYDLAGAGEVAAVDAILEGAVSAAMIAYTEENMESQVADMVMKEQEKKKND
jgi:RNA polymerase primary sigma factor